MRGEHWKMVFLPIPARGARAYLWRRDVPKGIIPACAGSTRGTAAASSRAGDHPRMRGEHPVTSTIQVPFLGSSPHARGAQGPCCTTGTPCRIIPACAGSTMSMPIRMSTPLDHPRMRGEHSARSSHKARLAGSSPHARGAHADHVRELVDVGIIPACAGSTTR